MRQQIDNVSVLALILLCVWMILVGNRGAKAVAEADQTVRGASAALATADAVLMNANRVITIDARHAEIRLQLQHASQNLMVCLTDGKRERCAISTEWREWLEGAANEMAQPEVTARRDGR